MLHRPIEPALSGLIGEATDYEATWIERRRKQWQHYAAGLQNEEPEVRQYFEDTPSTPWKPASARGALGWPEEVEDDETRARFIIWGAKGPGFIVPTWDELHRSHLANEERTNALSWAGKKATIVTTRGGIADGRTRRVVQLRLGKVEVGRRVELISRATTD